MARLAAPPRGLPPVPFPAHNPPSAPKIALGARLFFDPRLSPGGKIACATCHAAAEGFTQNGRRTPAGAEGRDLRRNAPTLLNVAYVTALHHDGSAPSLEMQILGPLFSPQEMANPTFSDLIGRLRALPEYRGVFEEVFGRPADIEAIGQAIASYERTLLSGGSAFDRWRYGGDAGALSGAAQAGFALFTGKARCAGCHLVGKDHALFTDGAFHNTGIGFLHERERQKPAAGSAGPSDLGRQAVTHDVRDRFKYRTPTLRDVARTAPYMHSGRIPTLDAVIRYYNAGGTREDPGLDPALVPLGLADGEIAALAAFLESLTGESGPAP